MRKSQQQFFLRGHQLRRVDLEKWVAFTNGSTVEGHMQYFHPSANAGIDLNEVFLIDHHLAHGTDGPLEVPPFRKGIPDAHVLGHDRVDPHRIVRRRLPVNLVRIDGLQIHAHTGLAGLIVDLGGVHGGHPIRDFALGFAGNGA